MLLLQDCREKRGQHDNIETYCRLHEIEIKRVRLTVGDYMLPNGEISVDVKAGGLQELANDLSRDYQSFNKKYRKCYEERIKLVVLIEEPKIKSVDKVVFWKPRYGKVSGKRLSEFIHRLKVSYGIDFQFCKSEETGKRIIEILTQYGQ